MTIEKKIETERQKWIEIAKARDWYVEPFYVQVWISPTGETVGSVSFKGMDADVIIEDYVEDDEEYDIID
jgi:hypothetical protein